MLQQRIRTGGVVESIFVSAKMIHDTLFLYICDSIIILQHKSPHMQNHHISRIHNFFLFSIQQNTDLWLEYTFKNVQKTPNQVASHEMQRQLDFSLFNSVIFQYVMFFCVFVPICHQLEAYFWSESVLVHTECAFVNVLRVTFKFFVFYG